MKLGICSMWGNRLDDLRAEVRLASDLGYDLVTLGDFPAGWHDLYVSLTLDSRVSAAIRPDRTCRDGRQECHADGRDGVLQQFDTIAGPVDTATDAMRALEAMGVSTLIAALPGHAAPLETILGLAMARDAMA
jgi:hypothetical protein